MNEAFCQDLIEKLTDIARAIDGVESELLYARENEASHLTLAETIYMHLTVSRYQAVGTDQSALAAEAISYAATFYDTKHALQEEFARRMRELNREAKEQSEESSES